MPSGILQALLSAISGIFSAINNVFSAKNTPEMKKAQEQQKEANFNDKVEKAIKEKNVKKIRDILSE
jgi:Na+-translocating ferredoxin:NAD+ oxidoreductase RnfG subunit